MREMIAYLESLNWKREVNYGGEIHYYSPDGEFSARVCGLRDKELAYCTLVRFTDSDVETDCGLMAKQRYVDGQDCDTLEELKAAMTDMGAV